MKEMGVTIALVTLCLFSAQALAQDPLTALPQNYKLQFENDWVKVTRVHYGPHEKLPAHQHTQTASAYVYLNDGGPVVFKHIGLAYGAITRPATKAGSFRLFPGLQEIHEVENLSELPSDFLRVEFKTEPLDTRNLHGRFYRESYPATENFQKVQFENEQVRITRLVCAAGGRVELSTSPTEPALLVALTPSNLRAGKSAALTLEAGQTSWIAPNQQRRLENTGNAPAELLRFDFKTKPLSKDALEKDKKHEHPEK
jgi:quercetin dioxygenase-like cupin family protein